MNDTTTFDNRCQILGDFWVEFKGTDRFQDFIDYNDLGLPLAFALATGLVKSTSLVEPYVNETFELLLAAVGLEDKGYTDIEDILGFETEG